MHHAREYWDQASQAPEVFRFLWTDHKTIDEFWGLASGATRTSFPLHHRQESKRSVGRRDRAHKRRPRELEHGYRIRHHIPCVPAHLYHLQHCRYPAAILPRTSHCTPARPRDAPLQWTFNHNQPSYNAAVRMGFRYGGTLCWHWVTEGKKVTVLHLGREIQAKALRGTTRFCLCGRLGEWG
jgi:hypothetical protein